jgi:hypothetical protein
MSADSDFILVQGVGLFPTHFLFWCGHRWQQPLEEFLKIMNNPAWCKLLLFGMQK